MEQGQSKEITVLQGTLDDANPLSKLRGNALVWSNIFGKVDDFYNAHIDRVSSPEGVMPDAPISDEDKFAIT